MSKIFIMLSKILNFRFNIRMGGSGFILESMFNKIVLSNIASGPTEIISHMDNGFCLKKIIH